MRELVKQPKAVEVFLSMVDKINSAVIDDVKIGEAAAADLVYTLFANFPSELEKVALLDSLGYDVFVTTKAFVEEVVLVKLGKISQLEPDRATAIREMPQSGFVWQIRIFQ